MICLFYFHMQFIDNAEVTVRAGHGGSGCVSFRREKYVPRGGPDGGDGGRGGHVIFRATRELNTLLDFQYKREYQAQKGRHGMGKKMHGKDGVDLIIPVPVGTAIRDAESNLLVADLIQEDRSLLRPRAVGAVRAISTSPQQRGKFPALLSREKKVNTVAISLN